MSAEAKRKEALWDGDVNGDVFKLFKYSGAPHSDDNPCSQNRRYTDSSLSEIKKPIGMH